MTSSRVNLHINNYEKVEIEGKVILVPYPTKIPEFRLIDREEILNRCLAAWFSLDGLGPLNFRLYGPPGVGKNALVYRLAQILNKDLYIINGHQELGPEDIACSATMTSGQAIEYVASSLFAAVWRGGILFFDEIGKAPTAALDPLASLLDDRRTLTSVLAVIPPGARGPPAGPPPHAPAPGPDGRPPGLGQDDHRGQAGAAPEVGREAPPAGGRRPAASRRHRPTGDTREAHRGDGACGPGVVPAPGRQGGGEASGGVGLRRVNRGHGRAPADR